jgi:hypothetical protein
MDSSLNTDKRINKLKNKKKDIIISEAVITEQKPKQEQHTKIEQENKKDSLIITSQDNSNNSENIKENIDLQNSTTNKEKKKVTFKENPEITEIKNEKNTNKKMNINNNIDSNKIINSIIYDIQLYLSLNDKIDEKLYNLITEYLSTEHLKNILEERDCRSVCSNMLCGKEFVKNDKSVYFNSKKKEFVKVDLVDFFCDVKCFQKFKDLMEKAGKFDYLKFVQVDFIYPLTRLDDFYPNNLYIKKITKSAKILLSEKHESNEVLEILKQKYNKYFMPELDEFFDITTKDFSNVELNKIFK